jgi:hypothetical protein
MSHAFFVIALRLLLVAVLFELSLIFLVDKFSDRRKQILNLMNWNFLSSFELCIPIIIMNCAYRLIIRKLMIIVMQN